MFPMTVNQNYLSDASQEENDLLLADSIQKSVVADNVAAWRFKTLAAMNPYMANNPEALMSMASMNLPDQQLFSNAGEIWGMSSSKLLADTLPSYSDSYQRAIFGSLSPGQQYSLNAMGYAPPERDVHSNGFWDAAAKITGIPFRGIGKILAPAFGPTFEGMAYASEIPKRAFRTIRQMDDVTQWIALAAGAAAIAATPVTAGASTSLGAALTSFGMRGLVGITAATGAAAVTSTLRTGSFHSFAEAWRNAEDGERLFTYGARKKANELLNDPDLERIAQEIALESETPNSLFELAQDIVGIRGGGQQTAQIKQLAVVAAKYADEGTPKYTAVYSLLQELLAEPVFVEALQVLERGKISYGRDLVRAFNVIPGVEMESENGVGRWVSGLFDAFMTVWLDPFNFAGGAYRAYAYTRRGLPAVSATIGNRLDELSQLPEIRRKWQVVADAVNADDFRMMNRGAREYKPMFVHLQKHKKDMGITELSVDDVFEFMKGTNQMQAMMSGIGLVPGLRYNQVKGLNRTQAFISNKTGAARDFLYGLADIGNETAAFGRIFAALADHPELQQQLAEHFSNVDDAFVQSLVNEGLDEQAARVVGVLVKNDDTKALLGVTTEELLTSYEEGIVRRAQEYVQTKLAKSSSAYRFGRTVGAAPGGQILKPLANFIDGLTSQIPRGSVRLIGDEMPLEIQRYLDLFRYAGVPSYVRDAWTQALIEAPTGGARIVGLTSLLDSVATATGMRMLDDGNKLLDKYLKRIKQIYSLDEGGRMTLDFDGGPTIPLGTLPDAEMASAWAIPDLHEIRKAVTQAKILNALIGIPESQVWQMLQNRIWKPMALLRLGFFTRNVGEELFATMMRYGTGSWIQERGARQLAQRDMYRDVTGVLREREMRGIIDAVDPADLWVRTARYDIPMIYRPVARAIDRLEGGQMWRQKLYDQLDFVSRMIERRADRVFARLEQGVASSPRLRRYAAETLGPYATVSTRRELFERQWKKMAFGSDHSFRRMLIGGVDKKMLMRAHAYERVYAKGMLEEIGTSRLAAWESTQTAPNVKRIIGGQDITDEEVMLVQTHSERILTTRDNAIPEAQPWWNAVLDRVAAPFDDKIGGSIYTPLVLWYNDDIQRAIPREELMDLLRPFGELYELDKARFGAMSFEQRAQMVAEGRRVTPNLIDRDLLQLFTEVHAGYFDKARFNAVLNRIEITPAKMAELQALPPIQLANGDSMPHPLLTWAERRNQLVNKIRDSYPGEHEPVWDEISSFFVQQLQEQGDVWIPESGADFTMFREFVPHTSSRDRVVMELGALANASRILADKPAYAREWIRNLLDHWQTNPTMINASSLLRSTGNAGRGPSPYLYRGVSNDALVSVDEDGNLIFEMSPQSHWNGRNATSFSLSELQAMNYAMGGVNHTEALRDGAAPLSVVFSFRLEDFLASQGRTLDDLRGWSTYDPDTLERLISSSMGDFEIVRLQPPGAPWTEGANSWSSAEIVFAKQGEAYAEGDALFGISFEKDAIDLFEDPINFADSLVAANSDIQYAVEWTDAYSPYDAVDQFISKDELKRLGEEVKNATINLLDRYAPREVFTDADIVGDTNLWSRIYSGLVFDSDEELLIEVGRIYLADHLEAFVSNRKRSIPISVGWGSYELRYGQIGQVFPGFQRLVQDKFESAFSLDYDSWLGQFRERLVTTPELGSNQVVIPRGSWDAEIYDDFGFDTDIKTGVLNYRTNLRDWPFFESEDDVRKALRDEYWLKIENGEVENQLNLNPRWMGDTKNANTFYVIDTRGLSIQSEFLYYDEGVTLDLAKTPHALGPYARIEQFDPIMTAAARQNPVVVKTLEDAIYVQNVIESRIGSVPAIQIMDVATDPVEQGQLVPWVYDVRDAVNNPGTREELVLYGWNTAATGLKVDDLGALVGRDFYNEFPAVWNYLDEITSETPIPVVDTFVDEIFARIRAGRRTRLEFIGDENAPEVWRNLGGTAHKLEAGDIVDPDDELYLTPTFEKDSLVSATDQRITRSFIADYEGENEVMWSILAPTLLDRNQGATGRQLVERKEPIKVPGRRDEWLEVTDMERRLRATTKRNVENTPAADLPDIEVAHSYKPYKANIVGSKVNKLFELMGKAIDTLSRKPMSFHAFLIAAERNEALAGWVLRESTQYKSLQQLLNVADGPNFDSRARAVYDRYVELGRIFAAIENNDPAYALQLSDRQAFAYIKGMKPKEVEQLRRLMGEEKWVKAIEEAWGESANRYAPVRARISSLQTWLSSHDFAGTDIVESMRHEGIFSTVEDIVEYVDAEIPEVFEMQGIPDSSYVFGNDNRRLAVRRIDEAAQIAYGQERPDQSRSMAWDLIRAVKKQMDGVEETAQKYAAQHAIRDVMPFVDSHEIRSQYAEFMRGVLPFWYAEENFLKRWAKILGEGGPLATLQRLERLRLTYMGLQTAGIVRTDQQGNDYFVYPGSELLADVVSKAFGLADLVLPGDAFGARINPNLEVLFQSPTDMILPGFRAEFGQPSVSPLITTPMSFFKAALPFLQPLDAVLIGEEYQHRGMLERIIPSSVYRVFEAGTTLFGSDDLNEVNERQAANMLAAMAHLQASGNGLPETNVTVEQRDEFIRRAAEHAKVIMVSQALAGYLLPGPPSALQLINGTSYEWITNGEITNPADLLAAEYYELIQNMGIEEGTAAWLEMNPSGRLKDILNPTAYSISKSYSASGAPLPSTEDGINFYETNKDVFDAFPNAAAWLLPQDESDARTQTAYTAEQVLGLREKRAPVDFVNAMIYREGAYEYFQSQDFYEAEYVRLKNEGKDGAARALKDRWTEWTAAFKATHPIFASELESGEARQRRKTTIQQMRIALLDPEFPKANHFDDLKMLQDSFDAYIVARGRLALDRTSAGQGRMQILKTTFNAWATAFVAEHPAVGSYWLTVLKPESGVD